ncbi:MAG TPA: glycosyltransferase family 2 protein [Vicinamibacterales bacterium]|jgi:dolichol-phosphate mannosyltransferase
MSGGQSLSIVVPAYNEAGNIIGTLENIEAALSASPLQHEVLVVDDGSSDGTGALVAAQAGRFSNVRLITNPRNLGFGATYRRGVEHAALDHIVMVHGDNAWGAGTLREFFSHVGEADIVIGYTRRMWRTRSLTRAAISKTFTFFVNLITGQRIQYYNGLQIHPAAILKGLQIQSSGYGFQAEVLAKSLKLTRTFVEVPMDLTERQQGESKAFRVRNAIDVMRTLKLLRTLE